jgi:hypothetical protein
MAQIKNFSATSPDATLAKAAAAGEDGTVAPARMAHVNAVISWIKDAPIYESLEAAHEAGLVAGDLYVNPEHGGIHIVPAAE